MWRLALGYHQSTAHAALRPRRSESAPTVPGPQAGLRFISIQRGNLQPVLSICQPLQAEAGDPNLRIAVRFVETQDRHVRCNR